MKFTLKDDLVSRIQNRNFVVGVVGLGYVGLPLAREFLNAGFRVLGFDVDPSKVEKLNKGESYIKHIPSDFISRFVSEKKFEATTDFSRVEEADALLICVPTPLGKHFEPDLTYIENTAKSIKPHLKKGHVVVLESTTYPGTTEEVLQPILEESGLKAGEDFFLGYSPEREDPGNEKYSTRTIPKIVSGVNEASLEVVKTLYDQVIVRTVPVSSPKIAESAKLLENIYRAVNIALVNELKIVFDRMGIDVWEVIEAAKTKPFGFQAFYPGPGLGGHCIPIDPFYLTWKAKEYEIHTRFIELAGEVNTSMPRFVLEKVYHALNSVGKPLKGSRILLLGVAYKPNVDDMRESPSLKVMELLQEHGAEVDYNDPYIPVLPPTRRYKFEKRSVDLTAENLEKYDLVVITTNHKDYDPDFILKHANLIVDTRNLLGVKGTVSGKVWKA